MEIAIGILGLIIAWWTFKKTFYSKPIEEKQNLLAHFLATQRLSKELSELMYKYAILKNALDAELYVGITYRSYINALEDSQKTNLSDQLYEKLKTMNLSKSTIISMQKSLEVQFEDLQKMHNVFKMASASV